MCTKHLVLAHESRQPLIAVLDGVLMQVVHEVSVVRSVVGGVACSSSGLQLCLHHPASSRTTAGEVTPPIQQSEA